MAKPSVGVFISYAHKDDRFFEVFKDGLISHLYTSGKFDFGVWEDSQIHLGSMWDDEIQQALSKGGLAILCVSSNFLNSQYIKAKEFNVLISKFPGTLIVPVYFNHCNIDVWDDLSKRQFFKPTGEKYGRAAIKDFSFCDLVKFSQSDGLFIPDSNLDIYFNDLVNQIEGALSRRLLKDETADFQREDHVAINGEGEIIKKPGFLSLDKIVTIIILVLMVASTISVLRNLLFEQLNDETKFKSVLGGVLLFGSLVAYQFKNKKIATA